MREAVRIFAEELDRHISKTGKDDNAWETEYAMALADEAVLAMAEAMAELFAYIRYGPQEHITDLYVRCKCLDVAAYVMMIFAHYHPQARYFKAGQPVTEQ